jgi:hypothetical protein
MNAGNAATTAGNASTADTSIAYLTAAAASTPDVQPVALPREDREDAHAEAYLDLLRWIHGGGTFPDPTAAAAALARQTLGHLTAARDRATDAPGSHADDGTGQDHLWLPAGPDPLTTAIAREHLRGTLQAISRLQDPQRRVIVSDLVGEPAADFERRAGWSSSRRKRTGVRGRDTLRTALTAAA